jgi:Protein of unknown function (DUF1761)
LFRRRPVSWATGDRSGLTLADGNRANLAPISKILPDRCLSVADSFVVLVKDTGERKERSMRGRNYLRIAAAALVASVASVAWYTGFGGVMEGLSGADPAIASNTATPAWAMLFVVTQSLVVASVLAHLVSHLGIVDRGAALRLGALVWIFPAGILLGSVVHENVPPALVAIHAGDWLAKLLLMSVILGTWRKGASSSGLDNSPSPVESRIRTVKVVGRRRFSEGSFERGLQ